MLQNNSASFQSFPRKRQEIFFFLNIKDEYFKVHYELTWNVAEVVVGEEGAREIVHNHAQTLSDRGTELSAFVS